MTVSPSNLQQCNPDEDAGHHRQVVLKPFLKLGDAAFNVDEVPLLSVLVKHTEKKHIAASISSGKGNYYDKALKKKT